MDKVWLKVEELAYKYPSTAQTSAWYHMLRKWRDSKDLTTPAHWHTEHGECNKPTTLYWEVKVVKLIFDNREKPGFANAVWYANQDAITRVLREFTASVRR